MRNILGGQLAKGKANQQVGEKIIRFCSLIRVFLFLFLAECLKHKIYCSMNPEKKKFGPTNISKTPSTKTMRSSPNPHSFQELKQMKYGSEESPEYAAFQVKSSIFRIGLKLREVRKELNLTQDELAAKIGTQKSHISRIERGGDVQLSTLIKFVEHGLGRKFHVLFGDVVG